MTNPAETSGYRPTALKRDSLITKAAEEICRFIDAQGLKPGAALPPETHLSEMLGISRNSVREALRVLHGLGVIEKTAGKSAVVTAASTASSGVVDHAVIVEAAPVAHEVRTLVMEKCAELAAERLSDRDLGEMAQALADLEAGAAAEDQAATKQAHDTFYGMLLKGARNPLLVALFNQAHHARLVHVAEPAHRVFLNPRHLAQHRAVLQALQARDGKRAAAAVRRHFLGLARLIAVATQRYAATAPAPETVAPLPLRRSRGG